MVERGPIRYCDGNQREYLADFVPVEKNFYPYGDAVAILDEHADSRIMPKLLQIHRLGGLGPRSESA